MRLPFVLPNAVVKCAHETGIVRLISSQRLVTVEGRPVVVEPDPVGRPIAGCNNINVLTGLLPCLVTMQIEQGYSRLLRIDSHRVCVASLRGKTSGTPVGQHDQWVRSPGQALVAELT